MTGAWCCTLGLGVSAGWAAGFLCLQVRVSHRCSVRGLLSLSVGKSKAGRRLRGRLPSARPVPSGPLASWRAHRVPDLGSPLGAGGGWERWVRSNAQSAGLYELRSRVAVSNRDTAAPDRTACRDIQARRDWSSPEMTCVESFLDREAWQAPVHGAAKSKTQLSNQHTTHD